MILYQYWVCDCGTRLEVPIENALGDAPLCPLNLAQAGPHAGDTRMKPPEQTWISCAAIKTKDGKVWAVDRPGRHGDVIAEIYLETRKPVDGEIQGFLTSTGTFLDRAAAEDLAREVGQVKGLLLGGVLTSEDLW